MHNAYLHFGIATSRYDLVLQTLTGFPVSYGPQGSYDAEIRLSSRQPAREWEIGVRRSTDVEI